MKVLIIIRSYISDWISTSKELNASCPNCWGKQEYQDRDLPTEKAFKLDLRNIENKKGWIEAYSTRNFFGLK